MPGSFKTSMGSMEVPYYSEGARTRRGPGDFTVGDLSLPKILLDAALNNCINVLVHMSNWCSMEIRISSNSGTPIYLQIVEQVRFLVASGQLVVGERLPAVRKLAERIIVNPNTVARAYRELEAAGIVESRHGSGAYVTMSRSPLNKREQKKIIDSRLDDLLSVSKQMDLGVEELIDLLRKRHEKMTKSSKQN